MFQHNRFEVVFTGTPPLYCCLKPNQIEKTSSLESATLERADATNRVSYLGKTTTLPCKQRYFTDLEMNIFFNEYVREFQQLHDESEVYASTLSKNIVSSLKKNNITLRDLEHGVHLEFDNILGRKSSHYIKSDNFIWCYSFTGEIEEDEIIETYRNWDRNLSCEITLDTDIPSVIDLARKIINVIPVHSMTFTMNDSWKLLLNCIPNDEIEHFKLILPDDLKDEYAPLIHLVMTKAKSVQFLFTYGYSGLSTFKFNKNHIVKHLKLGYIPIIEQEEAEAIRINLESLLPTLKSIDFSKTELRDNCIEFTKLPVSLNLARCDITSKCMMQLLDRMQHFTNKDVIQVIMNRNMYKDTKTLVKYLMYRHEHDIYGDCQEQINLDLSKIKNPQCILKRLFEGFYTSQCYISEIDNVDVVLENITEKPFMLNSFHIGLELSKKNKSPEKLNQIIRALSRINVPKLNLGLRNNDFGRDNLMVLFEQFIKNKPKTNLSNLYISGGKRTAEIHGSMLYGLIIHLDKIEYGPYSNEIVMKNKGPVFRELRKTFDLKLVLATARSASLFSPLYQFPIELIKMIVFTKNGKN